MGNFHFSSKSEGKTYTVPVGCYFATILNVNNTNPSTIPKLKEGEEEVSAERFFPERFSRSRVMGVESGKEYMISMFGHGKHACPGERFLLSLTIFILLS